MNKFIRKYQLQAGDVVVLPKSLLGIVQHYAVYIGQNEHGVEQFIENKIGHGVVLTSADNFFPLDGSLTRIHRFVGTWNERHEVIRKAKSFLGRSYNAMVFNCEHLVNHVRTGTPRSRQVENVGWILGGVLVLRYFIRVNKKRRRW